MTTIRYFIPEDGDTELSPNVFLAPKSSSSRHPTNTSANSNSNAPVLQHIKDAFPLPGRYHFRFKTPLVPGSDRDKDAMAVWMDCVQDNMPVPTWRGTVIAKVTRVSMEDDDDDEEDDDDDDDGFHHPRKSSSTTSSGQQQQQQHHQGLPPTYHAAAAPPPPAASAAVAPVFDMFDAHPPHATPPPTHGAPNLFDAPAPASASSLLDMDAPFHHTSQQRGVSGGTTTTTSSQGSDFFGMNQPPPRQHHHHTPSPPSGGYPGVPLQQQQQQPPQGYPSQQQQQQQQQQPPRSGGGPTQNAFDGFSQAQGPFGGLGTPWK